jgi:hypothetical protein
LALGSGLRFLDTSSKIEESMRKRVYIETIIPSFYYEVRSTPDMVARREWTRDWWDNQRHHYDLVTSAAVIEELSQGNYPSKEQALALISQLPLLATEPAIDAVVATYIAHYVMPHNSLGDALHLALTSYHGCHFLLTWNCVHLANANKFEHIRHVNTLLGLYVPLITTPVELLTWEGAADDAR